MDLFPLQNVAEKKFKLISCTGNDDIESAQQRDTGSP